MDNNNYNLDRNTLACRNHVERFGCNRLPRKIIEESVICNQLPPCQNFEELVVCSQILWHNLEPLLVCNKLQRRLIELPWLFAINYIPGQNLKPVFSNTQIPTTFVMNNHLTSRCVVRTTRNIPMFRPYHRRCENVLSYSNRNHRLSIASGRRYLKLHI